MAITKITDYLYIGEYEDTKDLDKIRTLNPGLIIHTLLFQLPRRELNTLNIPVVKVPMVDSIFTPLPMFSLKKGVDSALPIIKNGQNVLVYCKHGVHRSVAVAACILIAKGFTAQEAMDTISKHRSVADPHVWYISRRISKFAQVYNLNTSK